MRFDVLLACALAFTDRSIALSDSSPWVVISTASSEVDATRDSFQTSDEILKTTRDFLSTCPTRNYAVIVQPGLHYTDLSRDNFNSMSNLWQRINEWAVTPWKSTVSEVVGAFNGRDVFDHINRACDHAETDVRAKYMELPALPSDVAGPRRRADALASNDITLTAELQSMLSSDSVTVIFLGTQKAIAEQTIYEPTFEDPVNQELKRDVHNSVSRRENNQTDWEKLPLFEKYQFITPGILMGILATIVLGSILTVGLRALSSLEVSYGAFDKDMGPSAQKKQQ